jgi:D-sedoheptulose 7-phosphate isomerase
VDRYPQLKQCADDIEKAYLILEECYVNDGKLLIAGNGGSAADSEHIAGELMKRFKTPRPVTAEFAEKLKEIDSVRGENLAHNLERGLMAIPLVAHEALSTAYINDVDGVGGIEPVLSEKDMNGPILETSDNQFIYEENC